jgi:hypothetical protein
MEDQRWRYLYEDAVLELDPLQLEQRIGSATSAIETRFLELEDHSDATAERRKLEQARRILEMLRRNAP